MRKVWLIWIKVDGYSWLEAAWDDDSTSENHAGWQEEVGKVRKVALDQGGEMRIQAVNVPGVDDLFAVPEVTAEGV
jgi:hypothetical protein